MIGLLLPHEACLKTHFQILGFALVFPPKVQRFVNRQPVPPFGRTPRHLRNNVRLYECMVKHYVHAYVSQLMEYAYVYI